MIDLDEILTLADIPSSHARIRGDAIAISFDGRDTSFAALDAQSDRVSHALARAGTLPGDRISVLTKNHDAWHPLFFGTARMRACLTPINNRLSAAEIAFIIGDAGPKLLFVGEDFFETVLTAVAELARAPQLVALYGHHPDFEDFDQWLGDAPTGSVTAAVQLDDDILQLYTSGTTGPPKGVVLTNRIYRRFMEMAMHVNGFAYEADETVMIVMPLFHVAGTNVSLAALAQGSRIVIVKDFTAAGAIEMLQRDHIAHTFIAPSMIQMMLQVPGVEAADYSALRTIAYGASPISEATLNQARAVFGCGFVQFYGMTESAGSGSYLSPSSHEMPERLTSCGQPWPGVEMAIADGNGRHLGTDEIGEILIRGDIVMKGYWHRDADTAAAVSDGWLRTGDAGYRDASGHYFVRDRLKDMIVSGGENVYPAEVENAILGCPGVADVAVIGVPDERWGEAVKALVVSDACAAPSPESIIAWAKTRIASYKAPKSVEFVTELPRNPSGKILRRSLREPYWKGHPRRIG